MKIEQRNVTAHSLVWNREITASRYDSTGGAVEVGDHPSPIPLLEVAGTLEKLSHDARELRVRFDQNLEATEATVFSRSGEVAQEDAEIVRARFGVVPDSLSTDPEDDFLEEVTS